MRKMTWRESQSRTPKLHRSRFLILLLGLALVLAACGDESGDTTSSAVTEPPGTTATTEPSTDTTTPMTDTTEPATTVATSGEPKDTNLQFSYSATKQLSYAGSLIALRQMEEQLGYNIEEFFLPQSELSVQAVVQGEVDIGFSSFVPVANAIHAGADLVAFAVPGNIDFVLSSTPEVASVEDLEGRTLAVHSEASTTNLLAQWLIADTGADIEVVIIPGSVNRVQALIQGEIDSSVLYITDQVRASIDAPDAVKTLMVFPADSPAATGVFFTTRDFYESHQTEITDLVRTMAESFDRMNSDPDWAVLNAQLVGFEEEPDFIDAVVREYLSKGIYEVETVHSEEITDVWLQFMKETEQLDAGASDDPADYVDFSIWDSVTG